MSSQPYSATASSSGRSMPWLESSPAVALPLLYSRTSGAWSELSTWLAVWRICSKLRSSNSTVAPVSSSKTRIASSHAIPMALSGFSKCHTRSTSPSPPPPPAPSSPSEPPHALRTSAADTAVAAVMVSFLDFICSYLSWPRGAAVRVPPEALAKRFDDGSGVAGWSWLSVPLAVRRGGPALDVGRRDELHARLGLAGDLGDGELHGAGAALLGDERDGVERGCERRGVEGGAGRDHRDVAGDREALLAQDVQRAHLDGVLTVHDEAGEVAVRPEHLLHGGADAGDRALRHGEAGLHTAALRVGEEGVAEADGEVRAALVDRLRAAEQADDAVAGIGEAVDGELGRRGEVEVHARQALGVVRHADERGRHAHRADELGALVLGQDVQDDDPVDGPASGHPLESAERLVLGEEEDVVVVGAGGVRRREHERHVRGGVGVRADRFGDGEDVGPPAGQGAGARVRRVAELGDGGLDPLAGLLADRALAAERVGDGADGHAGDAGDVVNGGGHGTLRFVEALRCGGVTIRLCRRRLQAPFVRFLPVP